MSTSSLATAAPKRPGGFTLLEVMLALALSALVVVAVATAIDIHLRLVDANRGYVEEAQIARTLLNYIADDLRNVPLYDPPEIDDLVPRLSSGDGGQWGGQGGGTNEDYAGTTDEYEYDEEALSDEEALYEDEETTLPQSFPGLYGDTYELLVDTSRLPRGDELDGMTYYERDPVVATQVSEVRTVSYFVVGDGVGETGLRSNDPGSNGLVRREFDRASAAFAANNGMLNELQNVYFEPIAPEVAGIEFAYFDGIDWLDEWDSYSYGGLPVAVEITLYIIPLRRYVELQMASRQDLGRASLASDEKLLVYRRVVYLPVAKLPSEVDAAILSEEVLE